MTNWLTRRIARRIRRPLLLLAAVSVLVLPTGCNGPGREVSWFTERTLEHYRDRSMYTAQLEPGASEESGRGRGESWLRPPRTVSAPGKSTIRDMKLAEALRTALENNSVIRTRGGFLSPANAILGSPDRVASTWDPAIQESGVLFGGRGITAALSAFDPEFTTTMVWGRNETAQNNYFLGGGLGSGSTMVAETGMFTSEIRKQLGFGASLSAGHDWTYWGSNTPGQLFNSAYTGNVRLSYRQPLLAGSGTEFTRIAGPAAQRFRGLSGVNQGVVIARINNDLTLNQFESSAINLVKDVEDLYWDLYLAYRKWDTSVTARNSAQKSWRDVKIIIEGGGDLKGTTPGDEAQARDRYFQTRAQAQAALSALYRTETAFRRLLGLPVNDGTVLRPSEEPMTARFEPDWRASLIEALVQRVELRRHKWMIRSLELQLQAAGNLARPRLDLVSAYRVNAFGDDLFATSDNDGLTTTGFGSGYGSLTQGDHTGWNLGLEFTVPLGMRSAHAQVRNLELRLSKARAVLDASELEVSHELADAFQQLAEHDATTRSNFNRQRAAADRVEKFEAELEVGTKTRDEVLRAQASLADAAVAYYTSLIAYNQALTNLHYRSGTLLAANNVQLAESEWTPAAYRDALRRAWERSHGFDAGELMHAEPAPISRPGPLATPPLEQPQPRADSGGADDAELLFPDSPIGAEVDPVPPPLEFMTDETPGESEPRSEEIEPARFVAPIWKRVRRR